MSRIYEVPTHLHVEDALIAGLTPRQLLRLAAGASLAYGVWDQAGLLPIAARATLATSIALSSVLIALFQPGGRPLDQWLFAAIVYALQPHCWTWRLDLPDAAPAHAPWDSGEWVELITPVQWIPPLDSPMRLGVPARSSPRNREARA